VPRLPSEKEEALRSALGDLNLPAQTSPPQQTIQEIIDELQSQINTAP